MCLLLRSWTGKDLRAGSWTVVTFLGRFRYSLLGLDTSATRVINININMPGEEGFFMEERFEQAVRIFQYSYVRESWSEYGIAALVVMLR